MERESDLLLAVPSIHVTVAVIIPLYIPTCGSTALLPPDSVALLSGHPNTITTILVIYCKIYIICILSELLDIRVYYMRQII